MQLNGFRGKWKVRYGLIMGVVGILLACSWFAERANMLPYVSYALEHTTDPVKKGAENQVAIEIEEVWGSNGTIRVELNEIPSGGPELSDFTLVQSVDGGALSSIAPTAMTWSEITNTVVLSVPKLSYGDLEQQLVYQVSYDSGPAETANAITVAPGLAITASGLAEAVVVAPAEQTNAKVRAAAWKLAQYVKKSTGVTLPMVTEGESVPGGKLPIYVGIADPLSSLNVAQQLSQLDGDGFILDAKPTGIMIIGPTDWGTEFGVNEFLEAYVGVRWLLPGADGEHVPIQANLVVPQGTVTQEPSFMSRAFGSADDREDWAENNRLYRRVYLNHSMFELFKPSLYQSQHPDWYPHVVADNSVAGWQPCYSNPDTAAHAVAIINQYFTDNPHALSYSLGVNDGGGFCEANPTHPAYPDKMNSLGLLDMSDIYYGWVQTVAEAVYAVHPDRYLSAMAYHDTYDPPSEASGIGLPPNVIVYITDERMSWADPAMGSVGKTLTQRWKEVAPGASFYEYLYGGPYVLPRSYFHQLSDIYQYADDKGITAMLSEVAPNFGDGPKNWLAAKLQWDATADVDELLHDWYVAAVGEEAAPFLMKYFAHWEHFWQERVYATEWYSSWVNSSPRNNFMTFTDASYLKIVDHSEMAQSRLWLEQAVAEAELNGSPAQAKRARIMLKAFDYFEASVLTYTGTMEPVGTITSESMGISLLNDMVERLAIAEYRKQLVERFKSDSILSIYWSPEGYGMIWSGVLSDDVHALIEWIKAESPTGGVRARIDDIIQTESSEYVVHYVKLMLAMADNAVPLNDNPSFESGSWNNASSWWYWLEYGQTSAANLHRSSDNPRTGSYGLKANGVLNGGPVYEFSQITPGHHGMSAYYYVPPGLQSSGALQLFLYARDANGEILAVFHNDEKQMKDAVSGWHLTEWVGTIPDHVNGVAVDKLTMGIKMTKFKENEVIYLDDVKLFRLGDLDTPIPTAGSEPVNANGSFETHSIGREDARPWGYWIDSGNRYPATSLTRSDEQAATGSYSLKADSVKAGAVSQIMDIEPGSYKMSAWYKMSTGGSATGKIRFYADYLNSAGATIGERIMGDYMVGDAQAGWENAVWEGDVPAMINGQPVVRIRLAAHISGFGDGEAVYLDDMHLYRQAEPVALNGNATFETGSTGIDDSLPWSYWIDSVERYAGTSLSRSNEQARSGAHSVKANSVKNGAVSQIITIQPGNYEMSAWFRTSALGTATGSIKLYVDYLNAAGAIIGEWVMEPIMASNASSGWEKARWSVNVPAEVNGQAVVNLRVAVLIKDFQDGEALYLDDFSFSTELVPDSMNVNTSFEAGASGIDDALPWMYWIDPVSQYSSSAFARDGSQARSGAYNLKADGIKSGAVSQVITAAQGNYAMSVWYRTPPDGSAAGTIKLYVDYLDSSGNILGDSQMAPVHAGDVSTGWRKLDWAGNVPATIGGQEVTNLRVAILLNDFDEGEALYLDDILFYPY